MFHRVKSFAEVHSKKANCFTIRVIQVAVGPMLNWQESIGTVSTFCCWHFYTSRCLEMNIMFGLLVFNLFRNFKTTWERPGWMDEFCEEKYLYRTTFLVKKGKLKKCVFQWTPSKERVQAKVFRLYMWWPIVYYWSLLFFLLYIY